MLETIAITAITEIIKGKIQEIPRIVTVTSEKTAKSSEDSLAKQMYKSLKFHIEKTQDDLEEGQVLIVYTITKQLSYLFVDDIGYYDPNLLVFYGYDQHNNPCSQIVHLESVDLNFRVVKIQEDDDKKAKQHKRAIGFLRED